VFRRPNFIGDNSLHEGDPNDQYHEMLDRALVGDRMRPPPARPARPPDRPPHRPGRRTGGGRIIGILVSIVLCGALALGVRAIAAQSGSTNSQPSSTGAQSPLGIQSFTVDRTHAQVFDSVTFTVTLNRPPDNTGDAVVLLATHGSFNDAACGFDGFGEGHYDDQSHTCTISWDETAPARVTFSVGLEDVNNRLFYKFPTTITVTWS